MTALDLPKHPGFVIWAATMATLMLRGMAASSPEYFAGWRLPFWRLARQPYGSAHRLRFPPESFLDSVTVLKGPQSKHGPGNSAGVVMFERSTLTLLPSP